MCTLGTYGDCLGVSFPAYSNVSEKVEAKVCFFPNQAIFRKPENVGAIDFCKSSINIWQSRKKNAYL